MGRCQRLDFRAIPCEAVVKGTKDRVHMLPSHQLGFAPDSVTIISLLTVKPEHENDDDDSYNK